MAAEAARSRSSGTLLLADKKINECRNGEEDTEDDRNIEERPLQTAASVETRREVVRAESTAQRGARALHEYRADKQDREAYLEERQHMLEQNHRGHSSVLNEGAQMIRRREPEGSRRRLPQLR